MGFPVSLIFQNNNFYYKNILTYSNSNFINTIKNKKNNFVFIQNNFFSPILYDYFENVKVLDENIFLKISTGDVIILNQNKDLFIGDKKCRTNFNTNFSEICLQLVKKITNEFQVIYRYDNITVFEKK